MKNTVNPQPSQGNNQGYEPKNHSLIDIEISPNSIKKTRKALGLTVEHFAWLFGVSHSSIFRYENTGVPTLHHGTLTRKLHLLDFWLNESDSKIILSQLLTIRDGLPTLASFLEFGSVLMCQVPVEPRGTDKPQGGKSGQKTENPLKNHRGAPADPIGPDGVFKPPTMTELAKRWLRAFGLASESTNTLEMLRLPAPEQSRSPLPEETAARKLEAEAQLIEAEARKLEAEARKCEAEARIAKAKKSLDSPG
ncbi:MAG: hypothetical protein LBT47_12765 [Deltaproteobacteria bacterium]|jgi:transcriptional regulator with XRE-family HTH domain|nr:hypothetical protein [Deltaproteobacteria bacterium]